MSLNALTSLVIADSGALVGWTITAVVAFLLIGLPALYLLVLTLADDDDAFDRRVRDIEQYVELSRRAHAYAWGKDVYNALEKPPGVAPLAAADAVAAPRLTNAPAAPVRRVPRRARPTPGAAAGHDGPAPKRTG
jgi:hypothetical protein